MYTSIKSLCPAHGTSIVLFSEAATTATEQTSCSRIPGAVGAWIRGVRPWSSHQPSAARPDSPTWGREVFTLLRALMCREHYPSPLGQSAMTGRQTAKAPRQGPQERKHRLESSVQARASEYMRGVCVSVLF